MYAEESQMLLINQISKIFTIIEKSLDNSEICKIAMETLSNKCLENPIFIFPILENLVDMTQKGNLKIVEDATGLIETFFDEFNTKTFMKIISHDIFKSQFGEVEKELCSEITKCFMINYKSFKIENVDSFNYVPFDIFNNFDISQFEYLYSKDKDMSFSNQNNNGVVFTKMEMNVLFPNDDDTRKVIERSLITNNDNHISSHSNSSNKQVDVFYKENAKAFSLSDDKAFDENKKGKKVRKVKNNGNQSNFDIYINPFMSFINTIIDFNCKGYSQRLCSISLLKVLFKYFDKIYYAFYHVHINMTTLGDGEISTDINIDTKAIVSSLLTEKMKINLLSQLILDSIIDKVVDYTNIDYICISKEMNMKLSSMIINDIHNDEIVNGLTSKMISMMESFFNIKKDWQPLFAVLLLFKYMFISSNEKFNKDKEKVFSMLSTLMSTDSEDILNLLILILDKILESNSSSHFISSNAITEIFFTFIKLINRYDDIESGVRYYFNCLYNFIFYFLDNEQNNIDIIYKELNAMMNNEFILHSMNKIVSVRIKYFDVINGLLIGGKNQHCFKFSDDFIEKNILISYQGLCIEEDKKLLKTQQMFIMSVLMMDSRYIEVFIKHKVNLFTLLLEHHIYSLENFYIPDSEMFNKSEIEEIYRSFFLNSLQSELINKAYERKLFYIIPILSLILKLKVDFINTVYEMFNITNLCIIQHNLLLILKLYLYYLEFIEPDFNKMLIIQDETLKYFSENVTLNELPLYVTAKNINDSGIVVALKNFNDFVIRAGIVNLNAQARIDLVIKTLREERIINLKELNDVMKAVYDTIKKTNDNDLLKLCCELIKSIKEILTLIEKNQNVPMLRTKIRGYSSACLFIHSIYRNEKYNKISSIANSFLNCLKLNFKEGKIFVKYLLKLIFTLDNADIISKIRVTFLDNSIKAYNDSNHSNDDYVFRPIKYFFGEYARFQKYTDIQNIVNDYENNLNKNKDANHDIKILALLYLLCSIKIDINAYDHRKFEAIIADKEDKLIKESNVVKILSKIVINSEKLFMKENFKMKDIVGFLFEQINFSERSSEHNFFILTIIEQILQNNTVAIQSIDYIFTTLNYINHKDSTIRSMATSIFSKQMKIISMLKFDSNYDELSSSSSSTSLDFINKIFSQNIFDIKELKIKLKEQLRTYQLIGVNWLLFLGNYGLGLALCDDMGLGKTIQTLVTIAHASIEYRERTGVNPISLIICPTTLILNWILESKKFFDESELVITQAEVAMTSTLFSITSNNKMKGIELKAKNKKTVTIFISSYEKVRENSEEIFTSNNFFYLVLDEAHIVKNPKTKMYQSIRKINSERRVILTGTPIQNNVMELWSLFDFLMPGFLGNENDFEMKYHKKMHSNIKKLNLEEKLQENIFKTSLSEIRKRIKPFVLRRLKSDVLKELPEKIISDYKCEMTENQKDIYQQWEKKYEQPNHLHDSQFALIDKLRKICNHPLLLKGEIPKSINPPVTLLNGSGKLKSLEEIIVSLGFESSSISSSNESLSIENKVLIFTQYKQMCSLLAQFFKEKFPSMHILSLTSDTKPNERSGIVYKFNSDPTINLMILTTSVGGLGLNLTSANVVIMYDHNWNPTKDMQAIDRAHRIGQKKTVMVYRLITANSIEEKLISLQTFKKYIATNVVGNNEISETKVNANSVMESFEEFSMNKIEKKKKEKIKKVSKLEELTRENEEEAKREEMEIEYLKRLIDKD